MIYLDAETDDGCALATVLALRGIYPSTAQRCMVEGKTSSRLAYPGKDAAALATSLTSDPLYHAALLALQNPDTPSAGIPSLVERESPQSSIVNRQSSIRAAEEARALRAESLRQPPVIYTNLPNGKTLAISADLSPSQIHTVLSRALRT